MKKTPSSEHLILGALMSGHKHGYEILQFINSTLISAWRVSNSQLYTLLKRLENKGLLESKLEFQETRPSKRVFFLTEKGRGSFNEWLHKSVLRGRDFRLEFIAKLFFFYDLQIKGALELIDLQIRVLEDLKTKLVNQKVLESNPFNALVLGFKIKNIENLLSWLSDYAKPFVESGVKNGVN